MDVDVNSVIHQFHRIGARVGVRQRGGGRSESIRLDVARDNRGEFFDVQVGSLRDLRVIDAQPGLRHLLLLSTVPGQRSGVRTRFLCGHDERHWFVAGVPEARGVSNVKTAMEALKPEAVRFEQERLGIRGRDRLSRRTQAYRRQGEWFFVPRPDAVVDSSLILRHEPIARGGGSKPHWIDEVHRSGGEGVWVHQRHAPSGISPAQYGSLPERQRTEPGWRSMQRNARVLARGRVRHPDHATFVLAFWHEVFMNTEGQAPGSRFVAFLD